MLQNVSQAVIKMSARAVIISRYTRERSASTLAHRSVGGIQFFTGGWAEVTLSCTDLSFGHNLALAALQQARERARERLQKDGSHSLYTLMSEVLSHYFCQILLLQASHRFCEEERQ